MKKYSLLAILFFLILGKSLAQRPEPNYDPEKLQAARVAFITSRLDLKPEQAEKFWPIFNQYTAAREKNLKQISGLMRHQQAEISEADAKQKLEKKFEIQRKMINEEEKFVTEMSRVITYSQLLELNDIARDFTRQLYQRGKHEQ
jgi:hypothetical protein